MFPALKTEVKERFAAVRQYHGHSMIKFRRPELQQAAKGLAFVQIYAVYEYTVREVTRIAIDQIAAHAHVYSELKFPMLTIFLDPQMKSLRDCGEADAWDRRFELLARATSDDPISPVPGVMPHDGSHFRHSQTELVLKMLGVKRALTKRKRHLYLIDDVVQKRNQVAHGEETAVVIGRGSSTKDIRHTIRIMEAICLRLIEIVAEHCSIPARHKR